MYLILPAVCWMLAVRCHRATCILLSFYDYYFYDALALPQKKKATRWLRYSVSFACIFFFSSIHFDKVLR